MGVIRFAAAALILSINTGCFFEGFRATPKDESLTLNSLVGGVSTKNVTEDTALRFNLVNRANERVTFKLASQPLHGSVTSFDAATGEVVYQPNPNVSNLTDRIQFQLILDGDESKLPETYTVALNIIPVNDLPVVADINSTVNEDTPGFINAVGTDPDNDVLTFTVVTQPAQGTLTYDAVNSRWQYAPAANFNGSDSFTFRARDGAGESNVSTVRVTVTPVNDAPTSQNLPPVALNEDTPATITPVSADVDGDALNHEVVTAPVNGTVAYNAGTRTFAYTPRANFNGNDTFTFRARDAALTSANVTVMLQVAPVNDVPMLQAQSFSVIGGQTLMATIVASDPDNEPVTVMRSSQPQRGTVSVAANGQFTYQPAVGYFGLDTFTVSASDGKVVAGPVTITISVEENIVAMLARNIVNDCATNPLYNGCIFWKSPVAQQGAPFPTPISPNTNLSAVQVHAVNIPNTWYDSSGFLRNPTIDLYLDTATNTAARVSTAGGNFKYVYAGDATRKVTQVHMFYWLMVQIRYMKQRVGNFFAENGNIRVFASDPTLIDNAYYDSAANEIVAGRTPATFGGSDIALGADVTLHEMGHANSVFATNGAIFFNDGDSTKICRTAPTAPANVCCINRNGCSWAAGEGLADHHATLIFFSMPAIGEQFENNLAGLSTCGITRNTSANTNITADQVFNACPNAGLAGLAGEVHAVGSLYASIWYELKKNTAAADAVDIDKLFNEHLKVITGADTFVTLYNKIRAIDTALFGGKFGVRVQAEFQRRGII